MRKRGITTIPIVREDEAKEKKPPCRGRHSGGFERVRGRHPSPVEYHMKGEDARKMMHYGSYYTDDPAADAERYFSDLEATYPEEEKDYAVYLNFRLVVGVSASDREEAENTAYTAAKEILNKIKDTRLIDTEWLETTDVEEE